MTLIKEVRKAGNGNMLVRAEVTVYEIQKNADGTAILMCWPYMNQKQMPSVKAAYSKIKSMELFTASL